MKEKSSVPDPVSEKTVEKVLSLEKMKERYQSPEYIPVTFDMETQMVAESPNLYSQSSKGAAGIQRLCPVYFLG